MFIRTSAIVLALIGALSTFVAPVNAAARIMPLGDSITGSPVGHISLLSVVNANTTFRAAGAHFSGTSSHRPGKPASTWWAHFRRRAVALAMMVKTKAMVGSL